LIPDNVFDVSEQQSDGSVKSRTFKLVVSTTMKIQNDNGTFTNQSLKTGQNNLGEFIYTVLVSPVINTSTQMTNGQTMAHLNTASTNTNTIHTMSNTSFNIANLQTITYPLPPVTNTYNNLPPEPPEIKNNLTLNKNYVFTVTATLKEYVNNTWINAKNKNNVVVAQTVTKNFKTGSQFASVSTPLQQVH
jgi:hypothetical protein